MAFTTSPTEDGLPYREVCTFRNFSHRGNGRPSEPLAVATKSPRGLSTPAESYTRLDGGGLPRLRRSVGYTLFNDSVVPTDSLPHSVQDSPHLRLRSREALSAAPSASNTAGQVLRIRRRFKRMFEGERTINSGARCSKSSGPPPPTQPVGRSVRVSRLAQLSSDSPRGQ